MVDKPKTQGIGLADFIDELRRELGEAMSRGKAAELRFIASSIDIELTIVTERGKDAKAGLSFKVFGVGVEGGGGATAKDANTQKLKLTLQPVGRDGKSPLVSSAKRGV